MQSPVDDYGRSRMKAESRLRESSANAGMEATIVRPRCSMIQQSKATGQY